MARVSYKQALNILPEGSSIGRHAYYNNGYDRSQAGQVKHIIDRIFSMLDESAIHCIPHWVTINEIGGNIGATVGEKQIRRLDALFFTSDMQIHVQKDLLLAS